MPHESNSNAKAECSLGVLQRGIGACLSHADAPLCLWPWAALQLRLINRCLATTAHDLPVSARDFEYPDADPAEMGCFHVLFCNVVVALPRPAARHGQQVVPHGGRRVLRYLGYDEQRRADIVYVPSLLRIATYRVVDWCGENKFTIVKLIHAGTPVSYHQTNDMPVGQATRALVPARPPSCPCPRSWRRGAAQHAVQARGARRAGCLRDLAG